jgi:hypothetical protein
MFIPSPMVGVTHWFAVVTLPLFLCSINVRYALEHAFSFVISYQADEDDGTEPLLLDGGEPCTKNLLPFLIIITLTTY